ncbi:unnamed protein product [Arabis nemorensis]|uniref:Uncharacterized protein n=1 Tax=Arabis nemorensis TaxID=586526 RepID=A0A565BH45_9BRAS|nr:unnamed protein product [Arabis nemorensis]
MSLTITLYPVAKFRIEFSLMQRVTLKAKGKTEEEEGEVVSPGVSCEGPEVISKEEKVRILLKAKVVAKMSHYNDDKLLLFITDILQDIVNV